MSKGFFSNSSEMLTSFSYIMIGDTADTEYLLIDPDAEVGTLLFCFWKEAYVIGYVEYYGGMFTIVINMDDFDSIHLCFCLYNWA